MGWLCGCGRSTSTRHAELHAQKSERHSLALNPASLQAWCYGCEAELAIEPSNSSTRQIAECIELFLVARQKEGYQPASGKAKLPSDYQVEKITKKKKKGKKGGRESSVALPPFKQFLGSS